MINETTNVRNNSASTDVMMCETFHRLRIEYHGDSVRITDDAGYIKLHCFAGKGRHSFRVKIFVESVPDEPETIKQWENQKHLQEQAIKNQMNLFDSMVDKEIR